MTGGRGGKQDRWKRRIEGLITKRKEKGHLLSWGASKKGVCVGRGVLKSEPSQSKFEKKRRKSEELAIGLIHDRKEKKKPSQGKNR